MYRQYIPERQNDQVELQHLEETDVLEAYPVDPRNGRFLHAAWSSNTMPHGVTRHCSLPTSVSGAGIASSVAAAHTRRISEPVA